MTDQERRSTDEDTATERDAERQSAQMPAPDGKRAMIFRLFLWALALFIILPWLLQLLGVGGPAQISYTQFREQLEGNNVTAVTVRGEEITGRFASEVAIRPEVGPEEDAGQGGEPLQITDFVTYVPSFGDRELMEKLSEHGVEVRTEPTSDTPVLLLLMNLLPFLLLIGIGYMVFRRMRAQGNPMMSIGRSSAKLYERTDEATTFDDVAGAEGAKAELREIIEYLREPERSRTLGGSPPRGVLLVGPPGTGKTLLARATAGEANVPFFSITGSDFMEMFVGVGAKRVRDLFKDARNQSPAIVFIDELDSIGRQRGAGLGGGHDEREQTLNQLLSEMDGFEPHENVVLLAATNRPDILDPALLRPGRFDRRIQVESPGKEARKAILKVHAADKSLSNDVDLDAVARSTPGFSGADLANLLNEAALLAAREGKRKISADDIEAARDKIILGLEREGLALTESDMELLAYHEAGHAVVAASIETSDPIHKVSIVPRGKAMGVTQQLPERDRYVVRRQELLDRMAVMMGGRCSEQLVLDTNTSGAEDDLRQAVRLARRMVLDWGMSEELGPMAFGQGSQPVFLGEEIGQQKEYSETTAREIDQAVQGIVEDSYERAMSILKGRRAGLDRLAQELLEREEIPGREILDILGSATETPRQPDGQEDG